MYFTGFADEVGQDLELQLKAINRIGWKWIELREFTEGSLGTIDDDTFVLVKEKLDEAGVGVNCYGSSIANGRKVNSPKEDFEKSRKELLTAIPRMQILGTKQIRGFSFQPVEGDCDFGSDEEREIFRYLAELVKICEDHGILYLHENCGAYGSFSYKHSLRMLDTINSDSLKLVYDTGNCLNHRDHTKDDPYAVQEPWEFYSNIREHIAYVHIKDGLRIASTKERRSFIRTYPGEGDGKLFEIVKDLISNGYDGGFSIEPHMHANPKPESMTPEERKQWDFDTFVTYGHKLELLIEKVKSDLA